MEFIKMSGAGNDFILVDNRSLALSPEELSALAKRLCRRKFSIGADGLMAVEPSRIADFKMRFFNDDGSTSEMCGNGARCICRFGYELGLSGPVQRVETTAGVVMGWRLGENQYRIRLNDPTNAAPHRAVLGYDCGYVELGSPGIPHCVLKVEGLGTKDRQALKELARKLRFYSGFPKGANVNFYDCCSDGSLEILTYERGVEDFTLACGTGCGSTAFLANARGEAGQQVSLRCPGGVLEVSLGADGVFLSGPADFICRGTIGPDA